MLRLFAAKIILVEYARLPRLQSRSTLRSAATNGPAKTSRITSGSLSAPGSSALSWLPARTRRTRRGWPCLLTERCSQREDQWGKGHIGGVLATETANNAAIGGALIPFLSLGIPGDAANVQFIAALNVKGINVGPMFMREQTLIVYIIFIAALLSGIVAMLYETLGMKTFPALLKIPYHYLYSLIAILTLTGAYMATGSFFGLIVMLVSCIIGVLMDVFGIPSLPFLMAFILSPLLELNIRRGFNYSPRGLAEFFLRPISCAFIVVGLIVLIWGMVGPVIRKALKKDKTDSTANTGC